MKRKLQCECLQVEPDAVRLGLTSPPRAAQEGEDESRGSGALTSSLALSGFKRQIPESQEVARCLEQNPMH